MREKNVPTKMEATEGEWENNVKYVYLNMRKLWNKYGTLVNHFLVYQIVLVYLPGSLFCF